MTIQLQSVKKTFQTGGTTFTALKGIDLEIEPGEFVAIIGKSGSGKSTLLNMITGIDYPTSGSVNILGTNIHQLKSSKLAQWRGKNIGVIFQFFQLIPTLNVIENVMLPMDFCSMYTVPERKKRAEELLDRVGMLEHAYKIPSALSGGQQQRVAIARALANDPPIIMADEPTGSLDSKTANAIFGLFEELVHLGKTIVMVTHDQDLAKKVPRTIVFADGEIVNQYVVNALPALDVDQLTMLQSKMKTECFIPGSVIIREGDIADKAYIIIKGTVEVVIKHPNGEEMVVNCLGQGRYFGEIALLQGGKRTATVRASMESDVEVVVIEREAFEDIMNVSTLTKKEFDEIIQERLQQLSKVKGMWK